MERFENERRREWPGNGPRAVGGRLEKCDVGELRGLTMSPQSARVDAERITSIAAAGAVCCERSGGGVHCVAPPAGIDSPPASCTVVVDGTTDALRRSERRFLHVRQSRFPLYEYVFSGLYSWTCGQWVFDACRARVEAPATPLRTFSAGDTGSRWSGLTQFLTRQRWSM